MRRQGNLLAAGSSIVMMLMVAAATGRAQRGQATGLGDGPWTYGTANARYRAVVVTKGLVKPWSMAFLPDGNMLITELGGRLRIIRNGVLDPKPVAGVPEVYAVRLDGLLDIALHPKFAENRLVYIAYSKVGPNLAPGAGNNHTQGVSLIREGNNCSFGRSASTSRTTPTSRRPL